MASVDGWSVYQLTAWLTTAAHLIGCGSVGDDVRAAVWGRCDVSQYSHPQTGHSYYACVYV